MVDKESEKIVGIIDFNMTGMGHPIFDIGAIICHLLIEKARDRNSKTCLKF